MYLSRSRLAELEDAIELLQLAEADRGLNVRPPVVEPDADMMEPAAAVVGAALVAQAAQYLPFLFRVRHHHPTFARRHLLVRIEGEDGRGAVRAERPPTVFGPERLARVLDQREPVTVGDRLELVQLTRVAEHVDRDDRSSLLGDCRLDRSRVQVQRRRIDVREHGSRTFEDEAVRRRDEGERRRDHLVARAEARHPRQHVQTGRAARDGGCVRRADALGDLFLETVDPRPERQPA